MAEESKRESKSEPIERLTVEEAKGVARVRFNASPHAIAGALAGDSRESFTENQINDALKSFAKES